MNYRPKRYERTSIANNLIRTISKRGICSRKQALIMVKAGRVQVNGRVVTHPGYRVAKGDQIHIDHQETRPQKKRYYLFHKPAGVVTTRSDERGRSTIYDFLKGLEDWVAPVGRLDLDTEGLLLLTNDTRWAHELTEPIYDIPRTYQVWIRGELTEEEENQIRQGMKIDRGEKTRPAKIKKLSMSEGQSHLELVMTEGKNREIRRIFDVFKKPVIRLVRTHYGPYALGNLKPGEWREIRGS